MTTSNASGLKQRSAELLAALFGIVTGAMAFLPSVLGAIKPPFILEWLLVAFWAFGCVALLFLAMSLYVIRFTESAVVPTRRIGVGFWTAILALIALAVYVAANGWQDRIAPPEIQSIDISPSSPDLGETLKVSAVATNQSGKHINYLWSVDGKPVGKGQTIYWVAPERVGNHQIALAIDDGDPQHPVRSQVSLRVKQKGSKMADREKLIRTAFASSLGLLQQRYPKKYNHFLADFESGTLPQLASEEFDPAETHSQQLLVQGAFLRAVQTLPEPELQRMLQGVRPCCSKYPGIWPFCDPNC